MIHHHLLGVVHQEMKVLMVDLLVAVDVPVLSALVKGEGQEREGGEGGGFRVMPKWWRPQSSSQTLMTKQQCPLVSFYLFLCCCFLFPNIEERTWVDPQETQERKHTC